MPSPPKRLNRWTPCESWKGIYFSSYDDPNRTPRQHPTYVIQKFSNPTHPVTYSNIPSLNCPDTPRYINSQPITPRTDMGVTPKRPPTVDQKRPQLESWTIGEAPKFTQAFRIIRKFGGPNRLSLVLKEIDIECQVQTIYAWLRDCEDPRGTGGLIPSSRVREILKAARWDGVFLTAYDFDPRPLPLDELEAYFMYEVSEVYDRRYGRWRKIDREGVERALEKDIELGERMYRVNQKYRMRAARKKGKY